jgi:hypothetical protein
MMRAVMIVAGLLFLLLAAVAGAWGVTFWNTALAVAPDRLQGHPIWLSAELYIVAAGCFAGIGAICIGIAEVLYRLPR